MKTPDLASAVEKRDAAYEIKFLVPASTAESVLLWARNHLFPDPHAESSNGDGYRVNSLYFDTTQFDVYQRNGSYGKSKYRVRRYGNENNLFLERKLKSRGLVSKRRTRVPDSEVSLLALDDLDPGWVGYWFRPRLTARQLLPQCQIRYDRVARVGMAQSGPVRLTIDRNVCARSTADYGVSELGPWMPLLSEKCILELKFRQEMPETFKSLVQELTLSPQPVSKYRLSIQAFGIAPEAAADAHPASHNGHVSIPPAAPELTSLSRSQAT